MKPLLWTAALTISWLQPMTKAAESGKSSNPGTKQPVVGIDTTFGERYREAAIALHGNHYEETIAKATAALAMKPDGKNAGILYRWRGIAYELLGDFTRALEDYSSAIRSDPAVEDAHYYRAGIYQRRGDFPQAIADLNIALRREADKASVYALRAAVFLGMERRDAARSDLEQVLRFPAKDGWHHSLRAKAHVAFGQYKAAASEFAAAKGMDSGNDHVLNTVAWFEATCPEAAFRDGKAAVRNATRACELTKWKDSAPIDTLAVAYAETGDFARAIKFGTQAIAMGGALPDELKQMREHLRLFQEHKPFRVERKL